MNRIISIAIGAMLCLSPIPSRANETNLIKINVKLSDSTFGAEGETFGFYDLEDRLGSDIGNAGNVDGDEAGEGFFSIYIYTNSPDQVLSMMHPVLFDGSVPTGSFVEVFDEATLKKIKSINLPHKK